MTDDKLRVRLAFKDLKELKKKAKATFQAWCRHRDIDDPCISCGKYDAKFDGGHYYKAELYSSLIFDERNVNKQCSYCNDYLAGNLIQYRFGLIKKYGQEVVDELDYLATLDKQKTVKRTKLDYIDIILKYRHLE